MNIWKKIPGFSNYRVSQTGCVRSFARSVYKDLVQLTDKQGYKYVCIVSDSKKNFHAMVHRLVAIAFIPNPENKPQVNHKDGNKANNTVENLEWCTAKENVEHSYNTNLAHIGTKRHNAKLTKEQVIEIRKCGLNKTETYESLAKRFNIDASTIHDAAVGESYKDVDYPTVPIRRPKEYPDTFVQQLINECSQYSQRVVGKRHGLSQQTVSDIIRKYKRKKGQNNNVQTK